MDSILANLTQPAPFTRRFGHTRRVHTSSHVYSPVVSSPAACFREGSYSPFGPTIGCNCAAFAFLTTWGWRRRQSRSENGKRGGKLTKVHRRCLPPVAIFSQTLKTKSCVSVWPDGDDESRVEGSQAWGCWKLYSCVRPCCQHGMSTVCALHFPSTHCLHAVFCITVPFTCVFLFFFSFFMRCCPRACSIRVRNMPFFCLT